MKEEGPGLHPGAHHHQTLIGSEHHHGADVRGFTADRRQDGSGDDRIDAVELTRRLGFMADEYISLSWKRPGNAPWRYRVVGYGPHRLANHVATAGAGVNHYFLINPVRPDTAKRGRADEVIRLADLPVEIDGYKNGHASIETVCGFAIELSQRIGAVPVGIVESGGGWHAPLGGGRGEIGEDFPVTAAKELLLGWRALARPAHPARWLPAPQPDRQPAALSVRCAPVLAGSDSTTALARQQRKTVAR